MWSFVQLRTSQWLNKNILVGGISTPSEKWWTSSVGMMTFDDIPNVWKDNKCSKPPTSEPCTLSPSVLAQPLCLLLPPWNGPTIHIIWSTWTWTWNMYSTNYQHWGENCPSCPVKTYTVHRKKWVVGLCSLICCSLLRSHRTCGEIAMRSNLILICFRKRNMFHPVAHVFSSFNGKKKTTAHETTPSRRNRHGPARRKRSRLAKVQRMPGFGRLLTKQIRINHHN